MDASVAAMFRLVLLGSINPSLPGRVNIATAHRAHFTGAHASQRLLQSLDPGFTRVDR